MRRLYLLLGVCLVMLLILISAAGAQQTSGQGQAAIAAGAPLPPAYVLEADGTVINEGDVVTDCSSFLIGYSQGYQGRSQEEARMVADKCRQLGVPSSDFTVGNSEIVLSLGTTESPTPNTGSEVLPDTGGFPLTALAGSLALIGAGGLLLKRTLSYR